MLNKWYRLGGKIWCHHRRRLPQTRQRQCLDYAFFATTTAIHNRTTEATTSAGLRSWTLGSPKRRERAGLC